MLKKLFQRAAVALPVISLLFAAGCGTQSSHPNQVNTFDGSTYDTLLMAHAAFSSLQSNITASYPKYIPIYNQAAAAYNLSYATYASFRTTPTTQADVAVTINNLTVAIVALENVFQTDMQASPASVADIRLHARRIRSAAKQAGFSVSDLMTELEIAAAVADTIPKAGPYARLAAIVIQTTSAALAAESAAANQPIDLTLIQPIATL
jgi:hypothetical protein